jgi:hypothetical protein
MLHKLRDLAGKVILPSRKPSRRAQPDISHALPITNLRERLALLAITQGHSPGFAEFTQTTSGVGALGGRG